MQKQEQANDQISDINENIRSAFGECFLDVKLKRRKVKCLKDHISELPIGHYLGIDLLKNNGNIKTLHSCLHNEMGCYFYLLLEEGLNLTEISLKLQGYAKDSTAARTSIQYWADKYHKELKIISKDLLAKGRGTYYQRTEDHPFLHDLINSAAKGIIN